MVTRVRHKRRFMYVRVVLYLCILRFCDRLQITINLGLGLQNVQSNPILCVHSANFVEYFKLWKQSTSGGRQGDHV